MLAFDTTQDVTIVVVAEDDGYYGMRSASTFEDCECAACAAEISEGQYHLVPPNVTRSGQPRDGPSNPTNNPYLIADCGGAQAGGACKL